MAISSARGSQVEEEDDDYEYGSGETLADLGSLLRPEAREPEPTPEPGPHATIVRENIALLQVMLTRASAALGWQGYVETTEAEGEHYRMRSTKMSAVFQAYDRIARELRQWLKLAQVPAMAWEANMSPRSAKDSAGIVKVSSKPQGLAKLLEPLLEKSGHIMEAALEQDARERREKRERSADGADDSEGLRGASPLPEPN